MIERKALALSGLSESAAGQGRLTGSHQCPREVGLLMVSASRSCGPTGDPHSVSLPGHTQLLDGPVETGGVSDGNCGLRRVAIIILGAMVG